MKTIFSGVQPTGVLHIGNYFGALKQWVKLQNDTDKMIYCIVDMHAITVPQEPAVLKQNITKIAAWLLAMGIDPEKSILFVQSDRPEHTELMWILNTMTGMGQLERMTQYKEKSSKYENTMIGAGLFNYPTLMAADILLYKATHVPVGDDQKQHLELTRDLAERFNSKYGSSFVVPEPIISQSGARVMGLDDPSKKMSKSADSPLNFISLDDTDEVIRNKVKRAVTDSGNEIKSGADKPAMSNLLEIFAEATGKTIAEIESEFVGKGYGEFKEALAEAIIACLKPIRERYERIIQDPAKIHQILAQGATKIEAEARSNIAEIKKKVGLGS
ncbi:MAG: tryptophan--tRNA ligase [Candidatus Berkelbacteria bacterium]